MRVKTRDDMVHKEKYFSGVNQGQKFSHVLVVQLEMFIPLNLLAPFQQYRKTEFPSKGPCGKQPKSMSRLALERFVSYTQCVWCPSQQTFIAKLDLQTIQNDVYSNFHFYDPSHPTVGANGLSTYIEIFSPKKNLFFPL